MKETHPTVALEIERYLRTGESDPRRSAWSGGFMEREKLAHEDLRNALVREVRRLSSGPGHDPLPASDTVALTRTKVGPMVRGLFPRVDTAEVTSIVQEAAGVRNGWKLILSRCAPNR